MRLKVSQTESVKGKRIEQSITRANKAWQHTWMLEWVSTQAGNTACYHRIRRYQASIGNTYTWSASLPLEGRRHVRVIIRLSGTLNQQATRLSQLQSITGVCVTIALTKRVRSALAKRSRSKWMAACLNRLERYGRTMGVSECFRARVIRVQPSSLKVQSRRLSVRFGSIQSSRSYDLTRSSNKAVRVDPIG